MLGDCPHFAKTGMPFKASFQDLHFVFLTTSSCLQKTNIKTLMNMLRKQATVCLDREVVLAYKEAVFVTFFVVFVIIFTSKLIYLPILFIKK